LYGHVIHFSEVLYSVANGAKRNSMRLDTRGAPLTLGRRRRLVLQYRDIMKAHEGVVLERISPQEFLRQMTHKVNSHVPLPTVVDDIDEDLDPLPAPLRVQMSQNFCACDQNCSGQGEGVGRGTFVKTSVSCYSVTHPLLPLALPITGTRVTHGSGMTFQLKITQPLEYTNLGFTTSVCI
jgi:hypothetical protein